MSKLFSELLNEKAFIDVIESITDKDEKEKIIKNVQNFLRVFEHGILDKLEELVENKDLTKGLQENLAKNNGQ